MELNRLNPIILQSLMLLVSLFLAYLLFVKEIFAAQNFEIFNIFLPHLANLVSRLPLHNHLFDVVNSCEE